MTALQQEWCDCLRKHAIDHYEEDGWDYLIETMDNSMIVDRILNVSTYEQAFGILHKLCKMLNSRRNDVLGEVF